MLIFAVSAAVYFRLAVNSITVMLKNCIPPMNFSPNEDFSFPFGDGMQRAS